MDATTTTQEPEAGTLPFGLTRGLFWDLPTSLDLDPRKHAALMITRVVELGRLEDWHQIRKHYGDEHMQRVLTTARDLSPQAVALCCAAFDLTPEDFRCCTSRPFPPSPWIS